jgi:hypothetical protein
MAIKPKNRWSLAAFLLLSAAVIYGRFLLPRWLTFDSP